MYEQAEAVRPSFSGSGHTSRPPPRPVHEDGPRGHVRQGKDAPGKQPEDEDASSHTYEEAEAVRRHAAYTSADRTYPGGARGRRGVCSFLRAHRSCLAAGIAVLLSLVCVGLAPLTFINKQEISQLSTTFDAVKRDRYNMSAAVDALKRDQDGMSTTVDALKRDLDNERTRIAALEKRIHEIGKNSPSCPGGYTMWRGICYKAFIAGRNFSVAAATCGKDGGTLAMPRDAETDAFLISLYKPVSDGYAFRFGLQRKEGKFVWGDGSQLGSYSSWGRGQPNNLGDCVLYSARPEWKDKWSDDKCDKPFNFICQVAPGRL
ncbi:uncharacterized protein LOC144920446 [Branchiostoma floridae x Branchiostoma belcheri]